MADEICFSAFVVDSSCRRGWVSRPAWHSSPALLSATIDGEGLVLLHLPWVTVQFGQSLGVNGK